MLCYLYEKVGKILLRVEPPPQVKLKNCANLCASCSLFDENKVIYTMLDNLYQALTCAQSYSKRNMLFVCVPNYFIYK